MFDLKILKRMSVPKDRVYNMYIYKVVLLEHIDRVGFKKT